MQGTLWWQVAAAREPGIAFSQPSSLERAALKGTFALINNRMANKKLNTECG
jgi:hypothetical protein